MTLGTAQAAATIYAAETCFHVAECETREVLRTINVSAFIPASQT